MTEQLLLDDEIEYGPADERPGYERDVWGHTRKAHDPLCDAKWHPNDEGKCYWCGRVAEIRADEREQARQRVMDAPENVVKIGGISIAVIQRGIAVAAAGGDLA